MLLCLCKQRTIAICYRKKMKKQRAIRVSFQKANNVRALTKLGVFKLFYRGMDMKRNVVNVVLKVNFTKNVIEVKERQVG